MDDVAKVENGELQPEAAAEVVDDRPPVAVLDVFASEVASQAEPMPLFLSTWQLWCAIFLRPYDLRGYLLTWRRLEKSLRRQLIGRTRVSILVLTVVTTVVVTVGLAALVGGLGFPMAPAAVPLGMAAGALVGLVTAVVFGLASGVATGAMSTLVLIAVLVPICGAYLGVLSGIKPAVIPVGIVPAGLQSYLPGWAGLAAASAVGSLASGLAVKVSSRLWRGQLLRMSRQLMTSILLGLIVGAVFGVVLQRAHGTVPDYASGVLFLVAFGAVGGALTGGLACLLPTVARAPLLGVAATLAASALYSFNAAVFFGVPFAVLALRLRDQRARSLVSILSKTHSDSLLTMDSDEPEPEASWIS